MTPEAESKSRHSFLLARDLLDDVELGRLTAEALLLKASRLARLVGTPEEQQWLSFELTGYRSNDPTSGKYLSLTGRWINRQENTAYWGPLAQQDAAIEAHKLSLKSLSTQGVGGETAVGAVRLIANQSNAITAELAKLGGIRSRVLGLLHRFVARVYYEKLFSQAAASIFERYQSSVDGMLAALAGDVLQKLPIVYDRLAEADSEAISQAMSTCRRIVNAFADAVFPPAEEPVLVEGQSLKVGTEHHLNRLNAFIAAGTTSKSRRKRLRQTLANLYERLSAGVHDDVTPEEAQALVLSTYVLLGEVASLRP